MAQKTPHPDHAYILALLNDDNEKIQQIYKNYSNLVTSYVLKNSGTVDEAKDLFQEALISLYQKGLDGFVLTCAFKPYFLGICRFKWLDKLKASKKQVEKENVVSGVTNSINEGLDSTHLDEIVFHLAQENRFDLYREHFLNLGNTCQEIVGLSLVENETTGKPNSLKEIAEALSLNYSYVRREKNNCVQQLINAIQADDRYTNN